MPQRQFVEREQLDEVIRLAFGPRTLVDVTRLAGGSKKGVYRLTLDDASTSVLYVWNDAENYWPVSATDPANPFADASGIDLFVGSQQRLAAAGVRTPAIHLVDRTRQHYPADLAVVEELPGGTLETLLATSPERAEPVLAELGRMLTAMHAQRSPHLGKVTAVEAGRAPQDRDAHQIVRQRALDQLARAAQRVSRLAAVENHLEAHFRALADAIEPRDEYALIHGELGPDHVFLTKSGQPALIDIEGLMYFDVEWEHAFLELRFGSAYQYLQTTALDPARMRFYEFAQSVSLIEGPLRIADTDFPDRAFMLNLAAWHTDKVLQLAGTD